MNVYIIKYFFIILCSFYIYKKLLNIKGDRAGYFSDISCALFLNLVTFFAKQYMNILSTFILITLFSAMVLIRYKYSAPISLITATISFGFSYVTFVLAAFFIIPIEILLRTLPTNDILREYLDLVSVGIIQIILTRIPFCFKRLRNGMPFLHQIELGNVGFLISIFLSLMISLFTSNPSKDLKFILFLVLVVFAGILLLYWWLKRLRLMYLEKLKVKEIASLKEEIQHLQEEISNLKQNNNELSKLIHKDNKLIPAMEYAVSTLFQNATFTDEASQKHADDLLNQLNTIAKERNGILITYENTHIRTPQTGVIAIDAMCHYMEQKALAQGIQFHFSFKENIKILTDSVIDENMLTTLIADLIENAIISTWDCEIKNVSLALEKENNIYILKIVDSGKLFEREPLLHFGLKRFTTHQREGGSGIGLMTIYEILNTCKASFILDECNVEPAYTKIISICFDGLGQIRIHSQRPEILALSKERKDMIFFS